jgi:cytochrome c55X
MRLCSYFFDVCLCQRRLRAAQCEPSSEAPAHELVRMVRQDCGSCHGMTLNGGLGPALTVEALKERDIPKESLVATIVRWTPRNADAALASFSYRI